MIKGAVVLENRTTQDEILKLKALVEDLEKRTFEKSESPLVTKEDLAKVTHHFDERTIHTFWGTSIATFITAFFGSLAADYIVWLIIKAHLKHLF